MTHAPCDARPATSLGRLTTTRPRMGGMHMTNMVKRHVIGRKRKPRPPELVAVCTAIGGGEAYIYRRYIYHFRLAPAVRQMSQSISRSFESFRAVVP